MNGEQKLKIALVAVADILGYTAAVPRTSTLAEARVALARFSALTEEALEALNRPQRDTLTKKDKLQWRVRTYTDNYLLHTRLRDHGEPDLNAAFVALGDFQCALLRHGHLSRGGVALGPTYIDEDMVFGRPVVEAHYLEHHIAQFPRIVLSNGVSRLVARHFSYYGGRPYTSTNYHVLEDYDGQWFINYLAKGLNLYEDEHGWMIDDELFVGHRRLLSAGLKKFRTKDRIYPKYLWAATYHNWFVRAHALHEWHDGLLITIPGVYRLQPPTPVTDERIQVLMKSYRRRLRGNDEDFNDIVRIAARLDPTVRPPTRRKFSRRANLPT